MAVGRRWNPAPAFYAVLTPISEGGFISYRVRPMNRKRYVSDNNVFTGCRNPVFGSAKVEKPEIRLPNPAIVHDMSMTGGNRLFAYMLPKRSFECEK